MKLENLTDQQLIWLANKINTDYLKETKPLYKRHLGGRLLTVLKEIKNRGLKYDLK